MQLLLDPKTQKAYTSLYSEVDTQFGDPIFSTQLPLEVTVIRRLATPINNRIWDPVIGGYDWIRAGIGQGFQMPVAGVFTLEYDGDVTGPLDFDATDLEIQTALNLLPGIVTAGYVDVTRSKPGLITITFRVAGARTAFTADNSNLVPLTIIDLAPLIDGSASIREVVLMRIQQSAAAFVELTTDLPGVNAVLTTKQVGGGGQNHQINITLAVPIVDDTVVPTPYDGNFTISIDGAQTTLIPYSGTNTSGADLITPALEALATVGTGNVIVSKAGDFSWDIMFIGTKANTDMSPTALGATGLKVLPGKRGVLELNTPAMTLLIGGADSVPAFLQIEGKQTASTLPDNFIKKAIVLGETIIDPSAITPTPTVSFYTAAETDALFVKKLKALGWRFGDDGSLLRYSPDTGLFHPLNVILADPLDPLSQTLQVGDGVA